MSKVENQLQQ